MSFNLPWNKILMSLFSFAFLFGGLVVLGFGLVGALEAQRSLAWPAAVGKITSAALDSSADSDGGTMYSARIQYSYSVDGAPYEGQRVNLGEFSTSDRTFMDRIVTRYPPGRQVEVHYNPDDPTSSVLEPGLNFGLLLPLGIGVLFTLIGGWLTFNFYRKLFAGRLD